MTDTAQNRMEISVSLNQYPRYFLPCPQSEPRLYFILSRGPQSTDALRPPTMPSISRFKLSRLPRVLTEPMDQTSNVQCIRPSSFASIWFPFHGVAWQPLVIRQTDFLSIHRSSSIWPPSPPFSWLASLGSSISRRAVVGYREYGVLPRMLARKAPRVQLLASAEVPKEDSRRWRESEE